MTLRQALVLVLAFQFLLPISISSQVPKDRVDLIISGGTVVTMDATRAIYDDGVVAVKTTRLLLLVSAAISKPSIWPRRRLTPKEGWSCPDLLMAILTCP